MPAPPGLMIRSANATLDPDGVSSQDTRYGCPLTLVVVVPDATTVPPEFRSCISSVPAAFRYTSNFAMVPLLPISARFQLVVPDAESPAAGTEIRNLVQLLVAVPPAGTVAVTAAPFSCGIASEPLKSVLRAARLERLDGVAGAGYGAERDELPGAGAVFHRPVAAGLRRPGQGQRVIPRVRGPEGGGQLRHAPPDPVRGDVSVDVAGGHAPPRRPLGDLTEEPEPGVRHARRRRRVHRHPDLGVPGDVRVVGAGGEFRGEPAVPVVQGQGQGGGLQGGCPVGP